jgi:hypothetical protein
MIWVDPDFLLIPDPGARIQGSKKHQIPDPDPQDCLNSDHMVDKLVEINFFPEFLIQAKIFIFLNQRL